MHFRHLDASSMRNVKRYTDAFRAEDHGGQGSKLDLLVMTHGIMSMAGRTETPEGLDRKMALHFYSKQLLVRELLPLLRDDARVVVVYDGRSGDPSRLVWEDLDLRTHYSLGNAAHHCMAMTDAMVQYFAAKQQQDETPGRRGRRHFIHAWPGGVDTQLLRDVPSVLSPLLWLMRFFTVSADACAEYMMRGVELASQDEERHWHNIDRKGRPIANKKLWTEAELKTIADHTWHVIDDALAKGEADDGPGL
jgi:NAD(P)-dependent dehydrogenase (short-subunit alcohol dehydrogenase family)